MNNRLDFEKPIIELEQKIQGLKELASDESMNLSEEISKLEKKLEEVKKETFAKLSPWQRIQLARHPQRPYTLDYITRITEEWTELAGDRLFGNDKSIVGGIARFDGKPVVVLGHQKGRDTKENLNRNFAMPHPEGYRKVLRLMKLAEKFNLPVIAFIDTPGAYPGIGAEERGQAEAIARNLKDTAMLKTPIISIVIGEGGSGGALGLGLGNRILMLENAVYFVCTPEACSAILWKDRSQASKAAEAMHITAKDLYNMKVVDEIIPEPLEGAHRSYDSTADNVKKSLKKNIEELTKFPVEEIIKTRYNKYREIGEFLEESSVPNE